MKLKEFPRDMKLYGIRIIFPDGKIKKFRMMMQGAFGFTPDDNDKTPIEIIDMTNEELLEFEVAEPNF